jgi:hypothetical protein
MQTDLVITGRSEPEITVDNLEVAQFIYLLLNNDRIRHVIDTITAKLVLILGRFSPERKAVLDAIRDELRRKNYLPVLFDFNKPVSRDLTETISTLAHMARFVIADLTDPKSLPQELQAIVPQLPSVPVQPLLQLGSREWGMFEHFLRYPWGSGGLAIQRRRVADWFLGRQCHHSSRDKGPRVAGVGAVAILVDTTVCQINFGPATKAHPQRALVELLRLRNCWRSDCVNAGIGFEADGAGRQPTLMRVPGCANCRDCGYCRRGGHTSSYAAFVANDNLAVEKRANWAVSMRRAGLRGTRRQGLGDCG